MVRMLSQNDILSDTENQAVNTGGLANTDNWKNPVSYRGSTPK